MKRAYFFLSLFLIWCLASALWYLLSIKGLTDNGFHPKDSSIAIGEILIMLLVAVLTGFAIAWYMREEVLQIKRKDIAALLAERKKLLIELFEWKQRAKDLEQALTGTRLALQDDFQRAARERDRVKEELVQSIAEIKEKRSEVISLQALLDLEKQRCGQLAARLEVLQQQAAQREKENAGVRYFINPFKIAATLERNDIDDLKKIKGIGPVIERKLNMLGIVSFKQLSELNQEAIDQIAHTLKFFPDRIQRDRWVEQAREYMKDKRMK
jgi:predicted flap endonuclease-1-like 5' DNA nuclease